ARFVRRIASRLFTWRDALLIFGVYLFDGLVFAAIGVGVWALSPRRATTWALNGLGLCVGVYALTAMDLYGPHVLFRVHALAESFLPAVFLHLPLLFPVPRMRLRRAMAASYVRSGSWPSSIRHGSTSPGAIRPCTSSRRSASPARGSASSPAWSWATCELRPSSSATACASWRSASSPASCRPPRCSATRRSRRARYRS